MRLVSYASRCLRQSEYDAVVVLVYSNDLLVDRELDHASKDVFGANSIGRDCV